MAGRATAPCHSRFRAACHRVQLTSNVRHQNEEHASALAANSTVGVRDSRDKSFYAQLTGVEHSFRPRMRSLSDLFRSAVKAPNISPCVPLMSFSAVV